MSKLDKCIKCDVPFCEVCGKCETEGCLLMGKKASTKTDLIALKHLLAGTQKVRGYVALKDAELRIPSPFYVVSEEEEIPKVVEQYLATANKNGAFPKVPALFVRPCPVRPRHGFVDSRAVAVPELDQKYGMAKQVLSIFREAKAADPKAELLLVPTVDATHNLILTPSRMAIGTGNDGATAGHSSITVPLAGVMFPELTPTLLLRAAIDAEKEDPYIEVVVKSHGWDAYKAGVSSDPVLFTQLRAGAKIPASMGADFVPQEMEVARVIEASGDLLEWEKQVLTLQPGDVVYSVGGSLLSHYGVHCVYAGIPIITSHVPVVGEVLKPTQQLEKPDPRAIVHGLGVGASVPIRAWDDPHAVGMLSANQASLIVCTVLHNATAMAGKDGFWLGVATSLMIRLGMAASHGEARHSNEARNLSREYVYKLAFSDFFAARNSLGNAQERFLNYSWSSGYGGKKWAACTESVFDMDKAARALMAAPSDELVPALVNALNKAVNQAHNGGWWLNKFVPQSAFEHAAQQSMKVLASAGPAYLTVANANLDIKDLIQTWLDAGEIVIPEKVQEALSTVKGETTPEKVVLNTLDDGASFLCGDDTCEECYPKGVQVDEPQTQESQQEVGV